MTEVHQQNERFDFRAFMLKHQYKVMLVSVVAGFMRGLESIICLLGPGFYPV